MRIAHCADLHLGIRQFTRLTPQGLNQRETDVAKAFETAVGQVIAARPDAVLISGDIFHGVRPPNRAITFAYQQFHRLRNELPDAPVVMIAGNHDTPRSSDQGTILPLYESLGIHVATHRATWFRFPDLGLGVYAVPDAALLEDDLPLTPDDGPEFRKVLLTHGEVTGVQFNRDVLEYGGRLLDSERLGLGLWNYIALGHYHVATEVAPMCWYPGSLEIIGPNIWHEAQEDERLGLVGKCWLEVDLDAGTVIPHQVPRARTVWTAPPLDATDLEPGAVMAGIRERFQAVRGGIAGTIGRVIVENIPRVFARQLDHDSLRRAKGIALHLQVDCQPAKREATAIDLRKRQTLPELLTEFLAGRSLPAGIDREKLTALGLEMLQEAGETPGTDSP